MRRRLPMFLVMLAAALPEPAFAQARPDGTCTAAEYRSLDFLLGRWRVVHTDSGKLMGENLVEWINMGCAIRETLTFPGRGAGISINFYSPIDRKWHGLYHDSIGLFVVMEGNVADRRHVVTSKVRFPQDPSREWSVRQTSYRDDSGLPRQIGERLNSETMRWEQLYDVTFCPWQLERALKACSQ